MPPEECLDCTTHILKRTLSLSEKDLKWVPILIPQKNENLKGLVNEALVGTQKEFQQKLGGIYSTGAEMLRVIRPKYQGMFAVASPFATLIERRRFCGIKLADSASATYEAFEGSYRSLTKIFKEIKKTWKACSRSKFLGPNACGSTGYAEMLARF